MPVDYPAITVFITLARTRSFRVAAEQLGVTRPAVSQAIRKLEDRTGVALVQRTTRSVSLTEAGQELFDRVAPALSQVESAMEAARDRGAAPGGRLRLAVSSIAERFISGPLIASFIDAHPGVQVDVTVTDDEFDIVAEGYDAGVRLAEAVEQDMVAVPVSGPQRQVVVCAPSYLERSGTPAHPRELGRHRCIGWRPSPRAAPYRWEFEEQGRSFEVDVHPVVTTNDMGFMLRTACAGGGLTFGMQDTFESYLRRGELVALLGDYCPVIPGFFLYFAGRRNQPPRLRALIEHVRFRAAGP